MKITGKKVIIGIVLVLIIVGFVRSCISSSSNKSTNATEPDSDAVRVIPSLQDDESSTMETILIGDLIETASSLKESKAAAKTSKLSETSAPENTTIDETMPTAKSTTASESTKPAELSTSKNHTEDRAATTKKSTTAAPDRSASDVTYILNTNTMKFHKPTCKSVKSIKSYNYAESSESRDELIAKGYEPCGNCHP